MRKNYQIIIILFLVSFQFSCKKDKGNYDYTKPVTPSVSNAGLQASYALNQSAQLIINPVVNYAGDTNNLSYQWIAYRSGIIAVIGPPTILSTEKNLNVKLTLVPASYFLELIVTDKTTGVKVNTRATMNISAGMEVGWLVLHSLNNKSEVDFIVTKSIQPAAVARRDSDLFTATTGAKMDGEGRFISQTRRGSSDFNFINVGTNTSFQRMHGFSFAFINKDQQLFRRPLETINPQAHISNTTAELYINDGKLYPGFLSFIQDSYYSGPFRGDYYLEPIINFYHYNSYGAIVYDRMAAKFMYSSMSTMMDLSFLMFRAPSVPSPLFDLNNMHDKLLYMETGFSNYTYAFFKKEDNTGFRLNVINFSKADDGNLPVASYDMTSLPEIENALFFDVGTIGNVALYATGKAIYRYDYSGTKLAYKQFDGFAANEVITDIELFKSEKNANNTINDFTTTNNTVLFVATWDGTQGKVYEFSINPASGVLHPVPVNTYTGFGKVKHMAFKFRGTGV